MNFPFLLFDLDGTISDPLEGVSRSMNHALASLGYRSQTVSACSAFIGPPLDDSFRAITGSTNESEIRELIIKYRECYAEVGYSENKLYPGVEKSIHSLASRGIPMAICTSKRQDFAEKILGKFNLRSYFQFVSGGDIGVEKWQQIEVLLSDQSIDSSAIMIGDRSFDLVAAHKNGLRSVGVLWGYGSYRELKAESPLHLLSQPEELSRFFAEPMQWPMANSNDGVKCMEEL